MFLRSSHATDPERHNAVLRAVGLGNKGEAKRIMAGGDFAPVHERVMLRTVQGSGRLGVCLADGGDDTPVRAPASTPRADAPSATTSRASSNQGRSEAFEAELDGAQARSDELERFLRAETDGQAEHARLFADFEREASGAAPGGATSPSADRNRNIDAELERDLAELIAAAHR